MGVKNKQTAGYNGARTVYNYIHMYLPWWLQLNCWYVGCDESPSIHPSIGHSRIDPFNITLIHSPLHPLNWLPNCFEILTIPVIIDFDPKSKSLQAPIVVFSKTSGIVQSTGCLFAVSSLPFINWMSPVEQHCWFLQNVNDNQSLVPAQFIPQLVLICNCKVSVAKELPLRFSYSCLSMVANFVVQ